MNAVPITYIRCRRTLVSELLPTPQSVVVKAVEVRLCLLHFLPVDISPILILLLRSHTCALLVGSDCGVLCDSLRQKVSLTLSNDCLVRRQRYQLLNKRMALAIHRPSLPAGSQVTNLPTQLPTAPTFCFVGAPPEPSTPCSTVAAVNARWHAAYRCTYDALTCLRVMK